MSAIAEGGGHLDQWPDEVLSEFFQAVCAETPVGGALVSRALGVTAATLTTWRDSFLATGEAALASRPTDGSTLESEQLKARLGEMLLKQELLEQKITVLEGGRPLARRRSQR
jgi:hypothetical protein